MTKLKQNIENLKIQKIEQLFLFRIHDDDSVCSIYYNNIETFIVCNLSVYSVNLWPLDVTLSILLVHWPSAVLEHYLPVLSVCSQSHNLYMYPLFFVKDL